MLSKDLNWLTLTLQCSSTNPSYMRVIIGNVTLVEGMSLDNKRHISIYELTHALSFRRVSSIFIETRTNPL